MSKSTVQHHTIVVDPYEQHWLETNSADDNWTRRRLTAREHRARSIVRPQRCRMRTHRARTVRTPRKTTGDPDPEPESSASIIGTFATANDSRGAL